MDGLLQNQDPLYWLQNLTSHGSDKSPQDVAYCVRNGILGHPKYRART